MTHFDKPDWLYGDPRVVLSLGDFPDEFNIWQFFGTLETEPIMAWLVSAHWAVQDLFNQLWDLSRDAGFEVPDAPDSALDRSWLSQGLNVALQLYVLLHQPHADPVEVIDPQGEIGVSFTPILRMAEARVERGELEMEALKHLRLRLENLIAAEAGS